MNAINVARHKHFRVKPSFVDKKKMMKKSRFGKPSTQEIQEIMGNAVPIPTKKLQSSRLDYLAVHVLVFTLSFKSCKIKI